jgi:histidinol-phosphatase (PHP family)
MLSDSHMHTEVSTDSEASAEVMAEQAVRLGMKSICITDHQDLDYPYEGFVFDTKPYWKKMREVQEKYRNQIQIRIGVETGLQPHVNGLLHDLINQDPYDFVIGSVHLVDRKDPYYRDEIGMTDEEMYRRYFEYTLECLKGTDGYQTLGHLDYAVRYGYDKGKSYSYQKFGDEIDAILRELIDRGIALEVNTAGLKYHLGFPNPHPDVIKRYRELGGELITIGADAHRPEHIGYQFDVLEELLRACGVKYIAQFTGRKAEMIRI